MAKKQKYYVVWQGKQPGIYTDWEACREQVVGVQGAQYKSFGTMAEAEAAIKQPYSNVVAMQAGHQRPQAGGTPALPVLFVDESGLTAIRPDAQPPLPVLDTGDTRTVKKAAVKACKTKPPLPHTDASLLNLMENAGRDIEDETLREQMKSSGLGTPATRAATIERLIQVGYARRRGKTIVSTEKGRQLIDVVPEQIASAVTTGKWEKFLSDMAGQTDEAQRNAKSQRFMSGIRRFSVFLVDAAKNAPRDIHFEKETPTRRTAYRKAGTVKRTTRRKKSEA